MVTHNSVVSRSGISPWRAKRASVQPAAHDCAAAERRGYRDRLSVVVAAGLCDSVWSKRRRKTVTIFTITCYPKLNVTFYHHHEQNSDFTFNGDFTYYFGTYHLQWSFVRFYCFKVHFIEKLWMWNWTYRVFVLQEMFCLYGLPTGNDSILFLLH